MSIMDPKTVCVEGIPTVIPLDRVKDKLTIHFLRRRNGGAEIENIELHPGPPAYTLITFEDAEAVQRVLSVKDHICTVNGEPFHLKVTSHSPVLNPDEPKDPNPGQPYKGGRFEAYLPDNKAGQKILQLLKKAFDEGHTFKIRCIDSKARVTWNTIAHKTSIDGGKSRNGYPDAQYLKVVLKQLKDLHIE